MTRFLGGLTAAAIAGTLLFGAVACNDSTGPAGSIAVDQVVDGIIESPGQIVVYSLDGSEGQTLRAFFQGTSGDGRDSLVLQVLSPDGATLVARVTSAGSQPTLDQRATPFFTLPSAGRYRVEVRGVDTGTDRGPFRFRIAVVDLRPEVAGPTLTIGTVVSGESIGVPGDVDEFTFEGSAGDELAAFIQGVDGSRADSLVLFIFPPASSVTLRSAFTPGTADSVRAHGTGRLTLPASGTYRARVTGRRVSITMGYRLEIVRVSRVPERAAQVIPVGTIVEESIDFLGDIDEFYLDLAQDEAFTIRFERLAGTPSVAYVIEFRSATTPYATTQYGYGVGANSWTSGSLTPLLPPGRYYYRIFTDLNGRDPEPGAYRFVFEHRTP